MKLAIGIGCDRDTSLQTLMTALDKALTQLGLDRQAIQCLASIDRKSDETALIELARSHDWPLHFYPASELAGIRVPNPSEVVMRYMGTPAVAEAAAMLASGRQQGEWLLEKLKYRGADDRNATISIVRI